MQNMQRQANGTPEDTWSTITTKLSSRGSDQPQGLGQSLNTHSKNCWLPSRRVRGGGVHLRLQV